MPTPDYVLELRRKVGNSLLMLPGVAVALLRNNPDTQAKEVLLVQRADNGQWTPITGIVDPGEEPHHAAAREAKEEAGVDITITRVTAVGTVGPITYPNGDQCQFVEIDFAAELAPGSPNPFVADE